MICRLPVNSIANALEKNILFKTSSGFLAKISDNEYHKFRSHSKHSIAPALRSGIDYEFFTIEGRGRNKGNDSMDDGTLLHCLALERHEFENRYYVASDYDTIHKNNAHYFQTVDEFKAAIAEHNRKHQLFVKELKEAVKAHNKDVKADSRELVSSYDELPTAHKKAKLTDAGKRKAVARFKSIVLLPISEQEETELDNKLRLLQKYLESTYSESELQQIWEAPVNTKTVILSESIQTLRLKIDDMPTDAVLDLIPQNIVDSLLTQAAKSKAVSAYNKHIKETATTTLDEKAVPSELFDALVRTGKLTPELKNLHKVYHHKLINVGNKKSDKDVYTVADASLLYEKIYNHAPLIRSELIEIEKQKASIEKKELVTQAQLEHAERIISELYAHPLARKWLTLEGNESEVAMFWNEYVSHLSLEALEETNKVLQENPTEDDYDDYKYDGVIDNEILPKGVRKVLCKAKLDVVNLTYNIAIDIKFVSSVDMDKMNSDAGKFTYHVQDAYYSRGFNKIMETHPEGAQVINKFVFIFVEKDAPALGKEETKPIRIRVGSYKPADKDRANELIDASFLEIEHWVAKNHFDGFEVEEELSVPQYQARREMDFLAQHKQRMAQKANAVQSSHKQPEQGQSPTLQKSRSSTEYPSFDELIASSISASSNAA